MYVYSLVFIIAEQVSDKEQHSGDPAGRVEASVHGALPGLPGAGQVHAEIGRSNNCCRGSH